MSLGEARRHSLTARLLFCLHTAAWCAALESLEGTAVVDFVLGGADAGADGGGVVGGGVGGRAGSAAWFARLVARLAVPLTAL